MLMRLHSDLLRANPTIESVLLHETGPLDRGGFEMFCNAFKRARTSELCISGTALTPVVEVLAASPVLLRSIVSLQLPNMQIDEKVGAHARPIDPYSNS